MNDSTTDPGEARGWWRRLSGGLARSSASIVTAISNLVRKRKLDAAAVEELEDALIRADLGVDAAGRIAAAVGEGRYDKMVSAEEVKAVLATELEKILSPVALPLVLAPQRKPFVIVVAGVNGSGKTTSIAKLARKIQQDGKKVMVAACDTFTYFRSDSLGRRKRR